MNWQQVLAMFGQIFAANSPILVAAATNGTYYKNDPTDFQVEFDFEGEQAPAVVQVGTMKHLRRMLMNGGAVQNLQDPQFLQGNQAQIMNRALALIGAACFHEASAQNVASQALTKAKLDSELANISHFGSLDTRLLMSHAVSSSFRQTVGPSTVTSNPSMTTIGMRNVYDLTYPIIYASVGDNRYLAFAWETSFVIATPNFTIQNNKLYFEFHYDLQNANQAKLFS